jgi:hypothetical protein
VREALKNEGAGADTLFFTRDVDEIGTRRQGLATKYRTPSPWLSSEERGRGRPLCAAELTTARRILAGGYRTMFHAKHRSPS